MIHSLGFFFLLFSPDTKYWRLLALSTRVVTVTHTTGSVIQQSQIILTSVSDPGMRLEKLKILRRVSAPVVLTDPVVPGHLDCSRGTLLVLEPPCNTHHHTNQVQGRTFCKTNYNRLNIHLTGILELDLGLGIKPFILPYLFVKYSH